MSAGSPVAPPPAPEHLPPLKALVVLLGFAVAVAGYLALAHTLGLLSTFAGMLLVFYLFACKSGEFRALPSALLGGLGGILTGALFVLPGIEPGLSALLGLAAVLVALYFMLTGFIPQVFNQAYMLLVTVATIPALMAPPQHVGMALAITLSAAYFGAILGGLKLLGNWKARRDAKAAQV